MLNFDINKLMPFMRIEEISAAPLPYKRPRIAGKNARLDTHGWGGETQIVSIKAYGFQGFGWSAITEKQAELLIGLPMRAFFENGILKKEYRCLEFPVLDWLGYFFHKPVFRLVAKKPDKTIKLEYGNFPVPVYDTTIYFDELHIKDNNEAVDFILNEVSEGLAAGHRNFKIKIGRCGMWMPYQEGLKRDIEIVTKIRGFVGNDSKLMVDANNGYNLNITKEFLLATKDSGVYWLEEAFHEDNMLYTNLKHWMNDNGIKTLIADGEGQASPSLIDWAKKGLIDVIQYDLRGYGFFNWMELNEEIEPFGILCAPHNYGGFYGNFASGHFASCTDNFSFVEFDAAKCEGIDASAYKIKDGILGIPDYDGFGLSLDREFFNKCCEEKGFRVECHL